MNEKLTVGDPITEQVEQLLSITDEMTVGEFSHFFDVLFDGKAEVRIIHNKRRQFDEVPLKGLINPNHAAELMLDSSMTVGEAEKALTDCFVDIYPRYGNWRITKDMQLKDIKHIGGMLHDTFDSKPCEKY